MNIATLPVQWNTVSNHSNARMQSLYIPVCTHANRLVHHHRFSVARITQTVSQNLDQPITRLIQMQSLTDNAHELLDLQDQLQLTGCLLTGKIGKLTAIHRS